MTNANKMITIVWWAVKQGRSHARRVPAARALDAARKIRETHYASHITVDFDWSWDRPTGDRS